MDSLPLHAFHLGLQARFADLDGFEAVSDYGDLRAEHAALRSTAGILDLSFRGRLCLTGTDRVRFLHGQVTNDVNALEVGQGCYAALITAKGKMISDLNVYRLEDELLLDFEPGLREKVQQRLEQFIIADDVQVVNVESLYGLLSVQGPKAADVVLRVGLTPDLPSVPWSFVVVGENAIGEVYVVHRSRLGAATPGFELFVPTPALTEMAGRLAKAAEDVGTRFCGWNSLEIARIESGVPRYGIDMDETNLPPEAGLDQAISYRKGCYIGQEVLSRIRTYGQVAKTLRRMLLADDLANLPKKGDKLFKDGKEIGYVTSAVVSLATGNAEPVVEARAPRMALGYVRRECSSVGEELLLRTETGESIARIVGPPQAG